jgi:putative ABC transport system ATP-binding protein
MGIIAQAIELEKTYCFGETKVHALRNVTISLKSDTFYAVIGKSGSGKSTLLHTLSGLDKPDSGEVRIGQNDIYHLNDDELSKLRRKNFGIVFQNYNLLPEFTVKENILMPLYLDGSKGDKGYIKKIIIILGLKDLLRKYPAQLSGGEQQRVAIARALVMKPKILFADEPTGNLDKNTGNEVLNLLLISAKKLHQTIFLVTHDLDIANKADVVVQIEDGRIVEMRDTNECDQEDFEI